MPPQVDFLERGAISLEFSSGFTWTKCFHSRRKNVINELQTIFQAGQRIPAAGVRRRSVDTLRNEAVSQNNKRSNKEQNQVSLAEYTSPTPGARPSGSRLACGSLSRIFKPECVVRTTDSGTLCV